MPERAKGSREVPRQGQRGEVVLGRLVEATAVGTGLMVNFVAFLHRPEAGALGFGALAVFVLLYSAAVHGRGRGVLVAVGLLAVIVVGAISLLPRDRESPERQAPEPVKPPRRGPARTEKVGAPAVTIGLNPRSADFDGDRIWSVTDAGPVSFRATLPHEAPHPLPMSNEIYDLAADGDYVAITHGGEFSLLGANTGRLIDRVAFSDAPGKVELGFGAIWACDVSASKVDRFDTHDRVLNEIPVPGRPVAITRDRDAVWVGVDRGWVVSVNPRTIRVERVFRTGQHPDALLVAFGAVWVSHSATRTVTRIDLATSDTTVRRVRADTTELAAFGDSVFAVSTATDHLQRLDSESAVVTSTLPLPEAPSDIVATDEALYVLTRRLGSALPIVVGAAHPVRSRRQAR
jgi:hypothetical protein